MELKHLVKQFSYRIEPKPGGGFIARSTDPAIPALEASTREELQRQIGEKLSAALAESFPGLKIPVQNKTSRFEFHIEHKPEGGFSVHSTELGDGTMSPATHENIDHFAEQLLGFVDKHFPDLKEALAAQAISQKIEVVATKDEIVTQKTGPSRGVSDFLPSNPMQADSAALAKTIAGEVKQVDGSFGDLGRGIENNPITPQASGNWAVFRFLFTLLILALVAYLFLHHR
jgi:hypothetical protein